jgi:hypothetical protein
MASYCDHTQVLATANDSSGELAIFDSNGNLAAGPSAPLAGAISSAVANSDAGLSIVQLAEAPLGIGTLARTSGP